MITITCVNLMEWPELGFTLKKGENKFLGRTAVPAVLWPKLERAKAAGFLTISGGDQEGADLAGLKFEELKAVASGAGVDTAGMTSKRQVTDAILAQAESKDAADAPPAPPAPPAP